MCLCACALFLSIENNKLCATKAHNFDFLVIQISNFKFDRMQVAVFVYCCHFDFRNEKKNDLSRRQKITIVTKFETQ